MPAKPCHQTTTLFFLLAFLHVSSHEPDPAPFAVLHTAVHDSDRSGFMQCQLAHQQTLMASIQSAGRVPAAWYNGRLGERLSPSAYGSCQPSIEGRSPAPLHRHKCDTPHADFQGSRPAGLGLNPLSARRGPRLLSCCGQSESMILIEAST